MKVFLQVMRILMLMKMKRMMMFMMLAGKIKLQNHLYQLPGRSKVELLTHLGKLKVVVGKMSIKKFR